MVIFLAKTYGDILSKAQARLLSWGNQHLSMAERVVLIQSVLSALPSYLMQRTYLPNHVVTELEKLMRQFLWGNDSGNKKLHGVPWKKVCLHKEQGGLNIRDVRKANLAFLSKLGWHILFVTDTLWVEVLRSKYLQHHDFLAVSSKSTDSYT